MINLELIVLFVVFDLLGIIQGIAFDCVCDVLSFCRWPELAVWH